MKYPFFAYRHGEIFNPKTKTWDTFVLCGDNIVADTNGFFTMQKGCERDVSIFLGRYIFKNDTFQITPFNFIQEPQFLVIKRIPSTNPEQKIKFYTADLNPLNGNDSSWVIRLFKRKKSFIVDKTGQKIITVKRKKYDGMELLQMTKLFGVPIVLGLDYRFDYKVVINLPKEAVERFIIGGGSIGGIGIIKDSTFVLNNQKDNFKIVELKNK
ncbi:MAG: hypothetical protein WDM90_11820 [Ferruginibacter sp.]